MCTCVLILCVTLILVNLNSMTLFNFCLFLIQHRQEDHDIKPLDELHKKHKDVFTSEVRGERKSRREGGGEGEISNLYYYVI